VLVASAINDDELITSHDGSTETAVRERDGEHAGVKTMREAVDGDRRGVASMVAVADDEPVDRFVLVATRGSERNPWPHASAKGQAALLVRWIDYCRRD
jgi:hypothetical protein